MPRKKKKGYFDELNNSALGIAGLGVTTGVTAGVVSRMPGTHGAGLTQGLNTLSGFVPIGVTAMAGRSVLKQTKKYKKYY